MTQPPTSASKPRKADICIVGGAGHVGLPLALVFADQGLKVIVHDVNPKALEVVASGKMPFIEYGADPILERVLNKTLFLSSDPACVSDAEHVIIAIGTPVDEYLNPKLGSLLGLFQKLRPRLDPGQTIIIRSTVYPGTCRQVEAALGEAGAPWRVAYCPERIAQGYAIRELRHLPQIVSGLTQEAEDAAAGLFAAIAPVVIRVSVAEAELAKLFTNAWRYIQFATANQFYMIADGLGVDFNRIRRAMTEGYSRAINLPTAGFAAGPCLLKDTMQLAAFNNNNFMLGHAAMMINEGLPGFIIEGLRRRIDVGKATIGILGMAFKGDIDDPRDSLSYKIVKILRFHGSKVLCSDEFIQDPNFVSMERVAAECDAVIVAAPHSAYKTLHIPARTEVVDLWGVLPPREEAAV